jgi:hypothetical protein
VFITMPIPKAGMILAHLIAVVGNKALLILCVRSALLPSGLV